MTTSKRSITKRVLEAHRADLAKLPDGAWQRSLSWSTVAHFSDAQRRYYDRTETVEDLISKALESGDPRVYAGDRYDRDNAYWESEPIHEPGIERPEVSLDDKPGRHFAIAEDMGEKVGFISADRELRIDGDSATLHVGNVVLFVWNDYVEAGVPEALTVTLLEQLAEDARHLAEQMERRRTFKDLAIDIAFDREGMKVSHLAIANVIDEAIPAHWNHLVHDGRMTEDVYARFEYMKEGASPSAS